MNGTTGSTKVRKTLPQTHPTPLFAPTLGKSRIFKSHVELNTAEKLLEKSPYNEAKKQKFDLIRTKLNVPLSEDKTCYENRIFFNCDTKELLVYLRMLGKVVTASEINWKSKKQERQPTKPIFSTNISARFGLHFPLKLMFIFLLLTMYAFISVKKTFTNTSLR